MKSFLVFALGGLVFGGASLGVGYWLAGDDAILQGAAAFALTFVPAAGTLAWVLSSFRSTPEMQLLASLGGSGLRMAIALGGGFLLTSARPDAFDAALAFWLIYFYTILLAFEITLVVWRQPKVNGSPQA